MIPTGTLIELRRLHRFFGETRAVDDVSFEVSAGEVFGYIGPNGAGKTTSMRILSTLDSPSYGDALVDGFSVVNDAERVRRRLGFMPDAFGTYADVNCSEYLDFFARAYGLVGRDRTKACRRVMQFTGLDLLAEKPINGLSKGMKQRLCLGRALIHDPKVLVLDEPAAGLDPRARIELREMIATLAAEGKAVLISSHILTELAEICDSVGIIEKGQLLAVGPVAEIEKQLSTSVTVRVRVVGRLAAAATWLENHEHVSHVAVRGDSRRGLAACDYDPTTNQGGFIAFACEGGEEVQAAILREMIQSDFAVFDFSVQQRNLEELFLNITKGRVQ